MCRTHSLTSPTRKQGKCVLRLHNILPRLRVGLVVAVCALAGCGGDSEAPTATAISQAEKAPIPKPAPQPLREPIEVEWERLEMPLGEDNKLEPWMVPPRVKEL